MSEAVFETDREKQKRGTEKDSNLEAANPTFRTHIREELELTMEEEHEKQMLQEQEMLMEQQQLIEMRRRQQDLRRAAQQVLMAGILKGQMSKPTS